MISKEEAEEKLLKIFYDVKLDRHFKKKPTHANIDMFEETKDPEHLEHLYFIKGNELVIAMWVNSYEHGIPFFAVNMAFDSAKSWREDPFKKYIVIYILVSLILPFLVIGLTLTTKLYLVKIAIDLAGLEIFILLLFLKRRWKKRVQKRFKEFFKNTNITLSEQKIKKYSKLLFVENLILNGFQILMGLLILFDTILNLS